MSVTVVLHIQDKQLALVPTLKRLREVEMQVVTQGSTTPHAVKFPYIIQHSSQQELERMLENDPTVSTYTTVDWTESTGIYYIEYTEDAVLISSTITDADGVLLEAKTLEDGWKIKALLPDRESMSTIWEAARDQGMEIQILEMHRNSSPNTSDVYGLTEEQKQTLQVAFQHGYFEEPRETPLSEVAEKLDVSSTAASGRMRRGMRNLIAATIAEQEHIPASQAVDFSDESSAQ